MIDLETLAVAVSKMRVAQTLYAKKRTESAHKQAKHCEAEVDRLLTLLAPTSVAVHVQVNLQTSLFG